MNPEITPDQKKQLKSWADQRDEILASIEVARTEFGTLTTRNVELANSNTEIETKIYKAEGRLTEMNVREAEYEVIVAAEIVDLEKNKTRLESVVSSLEMNLVILEGRKLSVENALTAMVNAHDKIFARAEGLNKIISEAMTKNVDGLHEVQTIIEDVKKTGAAVVAANTHNVEVTNRVSVEIPRLLVEARRITMERGPVVKKVTGTP